MKTDCTNVNIRLQGNETRLIHAYVDDSCHFSVSAPLEFGIQIQILEAQSYRSIYNYFFVEVNSSYECLYNIVVLNGPIQDPCTLMYSNSSVDIYSYVSAMVELKAIPTESTMSKISPKPANCISFQTSGTSSNRPGLCHNLHYYNRVHSVSYIYKAPYWQFIDQSLPLLNPDLLDLIWNTPPLGLTLIAELPLCPTDCSCSLFPNKFSSNCLSQMNRQETYLIYAPLLKKWYSIRYIDWCKWKAIGRSKPW